MDLTESSSESSRSAFGPTKIWSGSGRDELNPPGERTRCESCAARRLQGAQVGEGGRPRNSGERRFAGKLLPAALFDRPSEHLSAIADAQRLYRLATVGSPSALPGPSSSLSRLRCHRSSELLVGGWKFLNSWVAYRLRFCFLQTVGYSSLSF